MFCQAIVSAILPFLKDTIFKLQPKTPVVLQFSKCSVLQMIQLKKMNVIYTFGHFKCKMGFIKREWQKVKMLPHLCSIKILL